MSNIKIGEALKAVGKTADAEKTFAKGLTLDGDFEILSSLLMYSRGNYLPQNKLFWIFLDDPRCQRLDLTCA